MALLNVKRELVKRIRTDIQRAKDLYSIIALHGMRYNPTSNRSHKLRQIDKRDAAQFIFFEIAAKYETFVLEAFDIEVRSRLGVSAMRVEYVIGNLDRGLQGVMGWGTPSVVVKRARNLFGTVGYFAKFEDVVGNTTYQRLGYAHKVRNRVAHGSGSAVTEYRNVLGSLSVPAQSRKGLSVGRLLLEYPHKVAGSDRWFYRFVAAYSRVVETFNRSVRVS
jgi:hypothetical protein